MVADWMMACSMGQSHFDDDDNHVVFYYDGVDDRHDDLPVDGPYDHNDCFYCCELHQTSLIYVACSHCV